MAPSPTTLSGVTPATPVTDPVPAWLATANELVAPSLRQAVSTLHPDLQRMAAYHRGWAEVDGRPTSVQSRGKGVRPALALWSAQAVGANPATALAAATAVELVHDFSILHDDIMDDDRTRRGRSTVWAVYGAGPAILLGDTLHALAQTVLTTAGPHGDRASARLAQAVADLCGGQAMDLAFEQRDVVSVQEYLTMVDGKTGALMSCSSALGAVLAGAEHTTIAEFDRLGQHIGVLFQIVDDLLGLFGRPEVTGKPVGSDIARRKKTLPIVAALASTSAAGRELAEVLRRPALTDHDIQHAIGLVEQAGGRARAITECAWHHQQAHATLHRLGLDSAAEAMLTDLLAFLINRSA